MSKNRLFRKNITNSSQLEVDILESNLLLRVPTITTAQRDAKQSPQKGEIIYDTSTDKLEAFIESSWVDLKGDDSAFVTLTGVETLTNKTIDADNNTLTNVCTLNTVQTLTASKTIQHTGTDKFDVLTLETVGTPGTTRACGLLIKGVTVDNINTEWSVFADGATGTKQLCFYDWTVQPLQVAGVKFCVSPTFVNIVDGSEYRIGNLRSLKTNGNETVIVGNAGANITTSSDAVVIGHNAGNAMTTNGNFSVLIGHSAGLNNTANSIIAIGEEALEANTTAVRCTAVGHQAGKASNSNDCTYVGHNAGQNANGVSNTGIGRRALQNANGGTNNTALGLDTGRLISTGSNNCIIGAQAGNALTTGGNNIIIGDNSDIDNNARNNCLLLGTSNNSNANGDNSIRLANDNTAYTSCLIQGVRGATVTGPQMVQVDANGLLGSATQTGWTAPTATQARGGFANGATTTELEQHLSALINDLITAGVIGA